MAVCTEANALSEIIKTATDIVQHLRNGRHKYSQDVINFSDKVEELRRKQAMWDELLHIYGAQAQTLVKPSLEAAKEILHREELAWRKRKGRCWPACLEISFPVGQVDDAIRNVLGAFENIPQHIRDFNEARTMLDEVTSSDLAALPFSPDPKYVALLPTVRQVRSALENPHGQSVVTLYGQPGSGKTSMAKYLALLYDDIRKDNQKQELRITGRLRDSRSCFSDGVFFLVCGPEATSKTLHLELWQNLGCRANFDERTSQRTPLITDQVFYSESMLHKQLMGRLANRSALIILDDVKHPSVLESILLPGRHIKYLVTSQRKRIWDDANQIEISTPSFEDAREILFNHVVGFPMTQRNEPEILYPVDYIIKRAEFNPLILANLALTISSERAADPREWNTAKKYLLDSLDDNDRTPVIFGSRYHFTVASTLTMAVNSLATEAKHLLFLVALCKGPFVSETVLMMFFKSLHGSLAQFQKWTNYLEDHAFIHVETHAVEWTRLRQRTWSVHHMRRHFVLKKQKDEIASMKALLLLHGKKENVDIIASLYLLFALTSASSTPKDELNASESLRIPRRPETMSEFTCSSVRPFVYLLHPDHENDEEWKEEAHSLTEQIIIKYVCRGELDDGCLSRLLAIPEAQPATCWAVQTMARSEDKALLTKDNGLSLRKLLALLNEKEHPKAQTWAAVALGALARKSHEIILTHPEALKHLVQLLKNASLANDPRYNVQMCAAWAIKNMAATPNAKKTMTTYVGLVDALLALLSRKDRSESQIQAAYALRRLADGELTDTTSEAPSWQTFLSAHPGMLDTLVALLGEGIDPDVQSEVVSIIGNLAASPENKVTIADHPHVFVRLVVMLDKSNTSSAQRHRATYALRRLIQPAGYSKLADIPFAFQRLVDILLDDDNLESQLEAAYCMLFLSRQEEYRASFAAVPGVLSGFVRLLHKDELPKSQLIAVQVLANLVEDEGNKDFIASTPGALNGLVKLLKKNQSPELMAAETGQLAIRCLVHLSFQNYENQLEIMSTPGALATFVALLAFEPCIDPIDKNRVPHLAAWTIRNLAQAEPNRAAIRGFTGALESLRKLLEDSDINATLASYVQGTIELLAADMSSSSSFWEQGTGASTWSSSSNTNTPPLDLSGIVYKNVAAGSSRALGSGASPQPPSSSPLDEECSIIVFDEEFLSKIQMRCSSWG